MNCTNSEIRPDLGQLFARAVRFIRTKEGKEKLAPALSSGNTEKTMTAPVTVIVAYDPKFYEKLPQLFPHNPDARSWFTSNDALAATPRSVTARCKAPI